MSSSEAAASAERFVCAAVDEVAWGLGLWTFFLVMAVVGTRRERKRAKDEGMKWELPNGPHRSMMDFAGLVDGLRDR